MPTQFQEPFVNVPMLEETMSVAELFFSQELGNHSQKPSSRDILLAQ